MKKAILHLALAPVLATASWTVSAQSNLDDITMTVVDDGAFEARRIGRPDASSIRQFMEGESGGRPAGIGRPQGVGGPDSPERDEIRALFESGDEASIAAALEQVQSLREEGGFTRPEGAPGFSGGTRPEGIPDFGGGTRPEGAPSVEEIRALIEAGDMDALEELRALREQGINGSGE